MNTASTFQIKVLHLQASTAKLLSKMRPASDQHTILKRRSLNLSGFSKITCKYTQLLTISKTKGYAEGSPRSCMNHFGGDLGRTATRWRALCNRLSLKPNPSPPNDTTHTDVVHSTTDTGYSNLKPVFEHLLTFLLLSAIHLLNGVLHMNAHTQYLGSSIRSQKII